MFELTGRQRLTVKRGIRNVGQFLAAEVTNPGQDESQQMFALCDRMDKERDILDRYSSPNESPDRMKEEETGQNPKAGVAPFFVSGKRDKGYQFWRQGLPWTDGESHAKLRVKKQNRGFQVSSWCDKMNWNCRQNSGEKWKESWTRE